MDFQTVIIFLIIVFATFYFGFFVFRKGKSFMSTKKECGKDCGCSSAKS